MSRWCIVTLAWLALLAVPEAAPAALTRKQADNAARKVLKVKRLDDRIALFRHPRPLRKGALVFEAGRDGARRDRVTVRARPLKRKAWLYWLDLAFGAKFQKPSRLLLIDAASGKRVRLDDMVWYPLIGRTGSRTVRRPAFLASDAAYHGERHRVFANLRGASARASTAFAFRGEPVAFAAATPIGAADMAADCMITIGDRDEFEADFTAMNKWADSVNLVRRHAPSVRRLRRALGTFTVEGRCKDVLLYIAGHGTAPEDWEPPEWAGDIAGDVEGGPAGIDLGEKSAVDKKCCRYKLEVEHETLTPDELKEVIEDSPGFEFKVKIDSCFSGRFIEPLKDLARVRIIETSSAADELSMGHIEDDEVEDEDGKAIPNPTRNPDGAGEFTNGNVRGLETWAADPDTHGRTLWEGLNAAFDLGADQDFARELGLTNPQRHLNRPPASQPPPPPPPPAAPVSGRFTFFAGDPNEIDFTLEAREAFDSFRLEVPAGTQVTNFLAPPEFPACTPQDNTLTCGGGQGLQPGQTTTGRIRQSPPPTQGQGGRIFIGLGPGAQRGPYPVTGP